MSEEPLIIESSSTALVNAPLRAIVDLNTAKQGLAEFKEFWKGYLVEGEDFGTIPGTPKPTLYKSGADKLCEIYRLADDYEIVHNAVDWEQGLFDYEIRCKLTRDGRLITVGLGCCSTWESKYRFRNAARECPLCKRETIIVDKFNGGFKCWEKKGGCGAKFKADDPQITGQSMERRKNPDIWDLKNTVLKMAKKRAKVDATLSATRSSAIFSQDMDDDDEPQPTGYISEGERKGLFAAAKRALGKDVYVADLKKYLLETHEITETTKVTPDVANDVFRWLNTIENANRREPESQVDFS